MEEFIIGQSIVIKKHLQSREDNVHAALDVVSIGDEDMLKTPAQAQNIAKSGQTDPAEPAPKVERL